MLQPKENISDLYGKHDPVILYKLPYPKLSKINGKLHICKAVSVSLKWSKYFFILINS